MLFNPLSLLKLLGSGIRPGEVPPVKSADASGDAAFAELLKAAESGELSSRKLVTIDDDAGVQLTEGQLAQLSLAADKAEASGVRTALVVLDDVQVVMDVGRRAITGRAQASPASGGSAAVAGSVIAGVDGVIDLRTDAAVTVASHDEASGSLKALSSSHDNASIRSLLERLGRTAESPTRRAAG